MRTTESISLDGRSIKQRVSIDFSFSDARSLLPQITGLHEISDRDGDAPELTLVPNGERSSVSIEQSPETPQFLYVPLLMPQKGRLMDRFEISRSDGRAAISLSYQQSLRVLALGLRYLILSALTELGNTNPSLNNADFETSSLVLLSFIGRSRSGRIALNGKTCRL